jgi:hypothetical protein
MQQLWCRDFVQKMQRCPSGVGSSHPPAPAGTALLISGGRAPIMSLWCREKGLEVPVLAAEGQGSRKKMMKGL